MGNQSPRPPPPLAVRPKRAAGQQKRKTTGRSYGVLSKGGQSIPLRKIAVDAHVVSTIATVTIQQEYFNDEATPLEATFSFPVDEGVLVSEFRVYVQSDPPRIIRADVAEKEEAQNKYEDIIAQGHGAYLAEVKEDSKDFIVSIGNLPAKTGAKIEFMYVCPLEAMNDENTYLFKLAEVCFPLCDYDLSIRMSLETPEVIETISCSSHDVMIDSTGGTLSYNNSAKAPLDQDFVVLVKFKPSDAPAIFLEQHPMDPTSFSAMIRLTPNVPESTFDFNSSQEYIILVDRSGSMYGKKIKAATEALTVLLHSLPVDCKFNIISFGTQWRAVFPGGSVEYNDLTLRQALAVVDSMKADMNGTQLLHPIEWAFSSRDKERILNLFVITDGEVDNTFQVLSAIKSKTQDSRVFSIGVGEDVDPLLVKGIARVGAGRSVIVDDEADLESQVMAQLRHTMRPVLRDVTLDWDSETINVEQAPSNGFTGYTNQPLVVFALFTVPGATTIEIPERLVKDDANNEEKKKKKGKSPRSKPPKVVERAKSPLTKLLNVNGLPAEGDRLTWAIDTGAAVVTREPIYPLASNLIRLLFSEIEKGNREVDDIKAAVLDIALKYRLASKYTSFIAEEERGDVTQDAMHKIDIVAVGVDTQPVPAPPPQPISPRVPVHVPRRPIVLRHFPALRVAPSSTSTFLANPSSASLSQFALSDMESRRKAAPKLKKDSRVQRDTKSNAELSEEDDAWGDEDEMNIPTRGVEIDVSLPPPTLEANQQASDKVYSEKIAEFTPVEEKFVSFTAAPSFYEVVSMQHASGSWTIVALLRVLMLKADGAKSALKMLPKTESRSAAEACFATTAMAMYIEHAFSSHPHQWQLAVLKARKFVSASCESLGLSETELRAIVGDFMKPHVKSV